MKLSLYGMFSLILPILPKVTLDFTFMMYLMGVMTMIYASMSTLSTLDVKELIAYSSVCHAAVYLLAVFSNTMQGMEGGMLLGLAHGFVSSGLFMCAGGVLYDSSHTSLISFFSGVAQIMPMFSILFFMLCLGNCGVPLSLNFLGEFLCLYGIFESLPLMGVLSASSIMLSAAYTMYTYNSMAFAGAFSKYFIFNMPDLSKRETSMLLSLVLLTVMFGIYPLPLLKGMNYSASCLIYNSFCL